MLKPILCLLTALWLPPVLQEPSPAKYDDLWPAWSPDGRRIAFTSTRDGDPEIYVMRADGTGARRLTTTPGRDAHPSWSPDGRSILFQSPREEGHTRIFLMDAEGGNQRALTKNIGFCGVPVWSPDARRILFQCTDDVRRTTQGKPWQLFSLDMAAAAQPVPFVRSTANDQVPSFSPDGRQVLFYSDRSGIKRLYLVASGGGEPTVIGNWTMPSRAASWSPDGKTIVFASGADGVPAADFYVTDVNGRTPVRLAGTKSHGGAVFSPDGRRIAFNDPAEGGTRIWIMDADGRNPRVLAGSS